MPSLHCHGTASLRWPLAGMSGTLLKEHELICVHLYVLLHSCPAGSTSQGAVAIIRISGSQAVEIAQRIFRSVVPSSGA